MRYVLARLDEYQRDEACRIYITRSLQLAPQSKWLAQDYVDIFKPADTRTAEDIIAETMMHGGLRFEG
jgi:hypothetical protein